MATFTNISKSSQSQSICLLVTENGLLLYTDPDLTDKLKTELPPYEGTRLDAFLPCQEKILLLPHSLAQAAESREQLALTLHNGLRLRLSARRCYCTPALLASLSEHNPRQATYEGLAWLLFGSCDDHRLHKFQIETRMRTTIASIIAGFAHEVRNPLAAILSLAEGVIHPHMDDETLRALSRIPFLVERIENLIKTALSYGKPRPPQAEWHKIGTLLRQSAHIIFKGEEHTPQELLPNEHMDLPVFADQDHVITILTNLLQNAIYEAGEEKVRIIIRPNPIMIDDVRMYCRTPSLSIDVIDGGQGIASAIHDTIFEPFFTTKSDGTGLGLAFARELARLNAGEVVLLESSERGSIFRIYLSTYDERGA